MWRHVYPDSIVSCGESGENLRRRIGRAIVEGEQLKVVKALGEDAFDGLFEVSLGLIDRHQHRDLRNSS
jgi:hypothetical protein